MLARFTLFSCAAALSVALLPSTAIATHVSCGDVITQDTTLDSDLNDCPGDGLVIGADGVTLDLRGHLLQATDASQGQQGVDNSAGHDDVTVTNGTIREFFDGVFFEGGDDGELSRLRVERAAFAVRLQGSSRNRILDNSITAAQIHLAGDSDDNRIVGNTVMGAGTAIMIVSVSSFPPGLRVPDRNRIERNAIRDSFFGVTVVSSMATVIVDNSITGSIANAIAVRSGSGSTLIEGNHITRNGFGDGERFFPDSAISVFNSASTTVVGNHVSRNAVDGVFFGPGSSGANIIDGNITSHNRDDGIDVDESNLRRSVTIARNKAIHNGDLGIEAVPGVTDGGGNKASANGNPAQCINVSCK